MDRFPLDGTRYVIYIFVVLDNFSRFIRLYPLKRPTAAVVTNRMINKYIPIYGRPICIGSDHGVQVISKTWQRRLSEIKVPYTLTSVYHPQSNLSQRVIEEL